MVSHRMQRSAAGESKSQRAYREVSLLHDLLVLALMLLLVYKVPSLFGDVRAGHGAAA